MELAEAVAIAGEVATGVARENAADTDAKSQWPAAALKELQKRGLGGLVVPKEHGGLGLGLEGLALVGMELGRECASTALCFGMHNVGAAVIAAKATPAQVKEFLEPICAGKHITTLALSEAATGAHFYKPKATLEPSRDSWILHGQKSFVTNGGHADSYVVSCEHGATLGKFSCAVTDNSGKGIEWQDDWTGMGMRGNSSKSVKFTKHPLPANRLLGDSGDHDFFIFDVVAPYFLVSMAGSYLGLAGKALQEATDHLTQRRHVHTGKTLAQIPVLQHRVGQLWARYKAARSYLTWACRQGDTGGDEALPALLASKALAGDVAVDIVNEAMTLVGGVGYRDGANFERMLRDVRAVHVMSPTTDLLYTWTGRVMLGEPIIDE